MEEAHLGRDYWGDVVKLCINCKKYELFENVRYCLIPTGERSLVTGDLRFERYQCDEQRYSENPANCGKDARHFEPK